MKYAKTEAGQQALKERSPQLTSRQRSAMILFDGKKGLDEVLAATAGLGIVSTDIDHMIAMGFLAPAEGSVIPVLPTVVVPLVASTAAPAVISASEPLNKSEAFSLAWPVATRLTATLGLRGFRLNLAVEAASGYDDLLALLPKITDALGPEKTRQLREALRV